MRYKLTFLAVVFAMIPAFASEPPQPKPVQQWSAAANNYGFVLDPENPLSPYAVQAITGPDFNVSTFEGAFRDVIKDAGVTLTSDIHLESIEAWKRGYGTDLVAGLSDIQMNGRAGVMFMTLMKRQGSEKFEIYATWMPKETYIAWGGITYHMMDNGLIPNLEIFEKERRTQIAKAPYEKQLVLFDKAADVRIEALKKQMSQVMAQQMLMTQMINLNLDLMFGDLAVKP